MRRHHAQHAAVPADTEPRARAAWCVVNVFHLPHHCLYYLLFNSPYYPSRRQIHELPELGFLQSPPQDASAIESKLRLQGKWGAPDSEDRAAGMRKIRKGARHTVPNGAELADRLQTAFEQFKDCPSAVTGQQLFTSATFKVHEAQMDLAMKGTFSGRSGLRGGCGQLDQPPTNWSLCVLHRSLRPGRHVLPGQARQADGVDGAAGH